MGDMECDDYEGTSQDELDIIVEEARATENTDDWQLTVNGSDSFPCPICRSATGRKIKSLSFNEILHHAGAPFKVENEDGARFCGRHLALKDWLEKNRLNFQSEKLSCWEREPDVSQLPPLIRHEERKYAVPFTGIVVNMRAAGQQEAPSTAVTFKREKVMEMFKDFNVKGVHSWGGLSHRRTIVVLSFQEGLAGLSGAKDFEQRFKDARQGREEWRMKHERRGGNHLDGHAYGWLADEETLTKDDCGPKVQKYLREKCEFKTLSQMEENERERTARTKACLLEANANLKEEQVAHDKHRQRFEDVLKEQTEKNSLLQADLKEQQEQAARKHDNAVAELKAQLRNAAVGQAEKEKIQRQKDEEMKKKQSEVDRAVALSKKHEKESAEMQMKMLELTRKQGLELRLSRLSLGGDAREEESEEYQSLKEEKEGLEESLNAVMVAERRANDELSAAKKFLIYLLSEKQLVEDLRSSRVAGTYKLRDVGVKKMGDLDMSIWNQTAEILARKHPSMADKWEEKVVMEASAFVKKLRNPSFEPFTIINPDTNPKKVLRKDDPAFVDLRKKLGDKVVADAQRALMELDEHNPSGRYPVPKLWHAREKRLATAEEACRLLARMLEAQHKLYNEDCGTEVKKRRVPP